MKTTIFFIHLLATRPSFWVLQIGLIFVSILITITQENFNISLSFISITLIFSVNGLLFKYQYHVQDFLKVYDLQKKFNISKYMCTSILMISYLITGYLLTAKNLFLIMLFPLLLIYVLNFLINDFELRKHS